MQGGTLVVALARVNGWQDLPLVVHDIHALVQSLQPREGIKDIRKHDLITLFVYIYFRR